MMGLWRESPLRMGANLAPCPRSSVTQVRGYSVYCTYLSLPTPSLTIRRTLVFSPRLCCSRGCYGGRVSPVEWEGRLPSRARSDEAARSSDEVPALRTLRTGGSRVLPSGCSDNPSRRMRSYEGLALRSNKRQGAGNRTAMATVGQEGRWGISRHSCHLKIPELGGLPIRRYHGPPSRLDPARKLPGFLPRCRGYHRCASATAKKPRRTPLLIMLSFWPPWPDRGAVLPTDLLINPNLCPSYSLFSRFCSPVRRLLGSTYWTRTKREAATDPRPILSQQWLPRDWAPS